MKHKVVLISACVIALCVLALYLGANNIVAAIAKRQLKSIFKGSVVTIGRCRVEPTHLISLADIKISAPAVYEIKIKDLKISYSIPSLIKRKILTLDLKLDSLDARGVVLENGYLRGNPSTEGAKFYIKNVKYNDVKAEDISGRILLRGNVIFLKSFMCKLFGGTVSGDASYRIDKNRDFIINLEAKGLDLGAFVREMKVKNKFDMAGRLNGKAVLDGNDLTPLRIAGDFSTDPAGGVLIIKDTSFLENMAKDSNQSLDILIESFKQYQYTIGLMKLSVDSNNLVMDVALEGASGKRNFKVVLHDFLPKKGWGL